MGEGLPPDAPGFVDEDPVGDGRVEHGAGGVLVLSGQGRGELGGERPGEERGARQHRHCVGRQCLGAAAQQLGDGPGHCGRVDVEVSLAGVHDPHQLFDEERVPTGPLRDRVGDVGLDGFAGQPVDELRDVGGVERRRA